MVFSGQLKGRYGVHSPPAHALPSLTVLKQSLKRPEAGR